MDHSAHALKVMHEAQGKTARPTSRPHIKFCGLTRPEDVALAEHLGAAYLGGIRAGGPRLLSANEWRRVLGPSRDGVARLAVLGAMTPDQVIRETQFLGADIAQWHGDPTPADVQAVVQAGVRVWPVLRVEGTRLPPEAWSLSEGVEALVLDAKVTGQLGGTGIALDWAALAADIAAWRTERLGVQLVLAGGLTADNVAQAIALLRPDVVDVSSGVERAPGIKDPERMRAFAHAVRGMP